MLTGSPSQSQGLRNIPARQFLVTVIPQLQGVVSGPAKSTPGLLPLQWDGGGCKSGFAVAVRSVSAKMVVQNSRRGLWFLGTVPSVRHEPIALQCCRAMGALMDGNVEIPSFVLLDQPGKVAILNSSPRIHLVSQNLSNGEQGLASQVSYWDIYQQPGDALSRTGQLSSGIS